MRVTHRMVYKTSAMEELCVNSAHSLGVGRCTCCQLRVCLQHLQQFFPAFAIARALVTILSMSASRQLRCVCFCAGSAVTNETRYLSADDPLGQPTVVLPRTQDVEYGEGYVSDILHLPRAWVVACGGVGTACSVIIAVHWLDTHYQ